MYLVIGKDHCSWCDKAKKEIIRQGEDYTFVSVDDKDISEAERIVWKDFLVRKLGAKSVPQIFKLVGGYDDLTKGWTHS